MAKLSFSGLKSFLATRWISSAVTLSIRAMVSCGVRIFLSNKSWEAYLPATAWESSKAKINLPFKSSLVFFNSFSPTGAVIRLLQKVLGLTYQKKGLVRPGYSESQLFSILKHGFNVLNMRSYSRFMVEFTDTLVQFFAARIKSGEGRSNDDRITRLFSIAGPLYRLAFQIDMLLFFTRGYYLIAMAKRRAWRPRKAPVLVDGRSISEAVLSRAAQ